MAVRRERKTSRAKQGKAVSWSRTLVLAQEAPAEPVAGDFFPPGFSPEPVVVSADSGAGELTTYFLYTEKRGLARYLPGALKHFQKGFRAALVSKGPLVFDQRNARVAGRATGDHFDRAQAWVKKGILAELQDKYVLSGGGKPKERERTARRFFKALGKVHELEEKILQAEDELDQASVEMVLRFGRKPFVVPGSNVTLDVSCAPGDKVYWRSRDGKLPELGK